MRRQVSRAVRSSTVRIGGHLNGFRALPAGKGKHPAVILLHERYGVVRHTRDLILRLAQAGYVGVAPDLFSRFTGDRKALVRGDTRVELRDDEVIKDLGKVVHYLKKLDTVEASRIGIVGVCQTGRHSLLLAAHREDIATCALFYGAVGRKEWSTDERKPESIESLVERLACPLLGVFGESDHIISLDHILKFRSCLEQNKKSYHIRLYRDAPHGWLNDTMPGRYREIAARDAWRLLLSFLRKTFTKRWDKSRVLWTFESDVSPSYDFDKNIRLE
ncbi:MAG: dienelactone hydrolase family protein [Candidatus Binatia bacterium]